MANDLSFDIVGVDKASDVFSKVGKSVGDAGNKLGDIGNAGDKAAKSVDDVAAKLGKIKPPPPIKLDVEVDKSDKVAAQLGKIKAPPIKVPVKIDEDNLGESLKKAGEVGANAFGGGFAGALAGGDLLGGLTDGIKDALNSTAENKNFLATLQNQMGISPQQAKDYGSRIASEYASGLGESKDQIAEVYSTLSSDVSNWGKITKDQQDTIAKNQTKIVQSFGVDVGQSIAAASSVVQNKLVPTWQDAQDLLVTGFQTLGARGDDWAETLQEYSGYFVQLGITGPQALGLIQQGLQAGARDTDYVADVWKEVGIRIIDTSQSTKDALKDLFKGTKTNVKDLQETIAKGGPPAEAALEKVITRLQGIKDPVEKNRLGVALFGTQYEDTFKRVIDTTDLAKAKLTEYQGATDKLVTNTRTLTEHLGILWDGVNARAGKTIDELKTKLGNGDWVTPSSNAVDLFAGAAKDGDAAAHNLGVSLDGTARGFMTLVADLGGPGAQAFKDTILHMSDTELAALGVTSKLDNLGNRVLTMPDGKPIIINHNTGEVISGLDTLTRKLNAIQPYTTKVFDFVWHNIVTGSPPPQAPFPIPLGHAQGGWVHGPGTTTSDSIPRMLSDKEFVVNAEAAKRNAPILEAINAGRRLVGATGSAASGRFDGGGWDGNLRLDVTGVEGQFSRLIADAVRKGLRKSGKGGNLGAWVGAT